MTIGEFRNSEKLDVCDTYDVFHHGKWEKEYDDSTVVKDMWLDVWTWSYLPEIDMIVDGSDHGEIFALWYIEI